MVGIGIGILLPLLLFAFGGYRDPQSKAQRRGSVCLCVNEIMKDDHAKAIDNLRSWGTAKKELSHHAGLRRASVLVPLFERSHGGVATIHVLFTRRPMGMKSHPGEVCFPGGKQDDRDGGDDVVTATREAHEEVGLCPRCVECLARMETVESKHSLCVTPIVGRIAPPSAAEPSNLSLNPEEVEAVFAVPLRYFADPDNCEAVTKLKWGGRDFLMRTYLYDDPESGNQFKIWGLTAHVIHQVATVAFAT